MLSYKLLLLLLAISSTSSVKNATGLGKKPAAARGCARLKCPPVDEPVCARLVRRPGNAVYVMMVNKCEMNYVKCHKGLEGAVVPMKNCDHNYFLKTKGSKRSKRDAEEESSKQLNAEIVKTQGAPPSHEAVDAPADLLPETAPDEQASSHLGDMDAERFSEIDEWNGDYDLDGYPDATGQPDYADAAQPDEFNEEDYAEYPQGGVQEESEYKDGDLQGDNGAEEGGLDYQQEQGDYMPGADGAEGGLDYQQGDYTQGANDAQGGPDYQQGDYTQGANGPEGGPDYQQDDYFQGAYDQGDYNYQQGQDGNLPLNYADPERNMLHAAIATDQNFKDAIFDHVNQRQYDADCPSVCPLRDVMVCARCQHGVYRTFLTVCHLRMFVCQHREETLALVSREACVLSAPFLSDPGSAPQGRVREPTDDDRVLRYLRCNQLSPGSREADPRCYWLLDSNNGQQNLMMSIQDDY